MHWMTKSDEHDWDAYVIDSGVTSPNTILYVCFSIHAICLSNDKITKGSLFMVQVHIAVLGLNRIKQQLHDEELDCHCDCVRERH